MFDLKDTTFIIPIRIESEDRMRNIITVLCYLLENFDTNVILKEVDKESVFEENVLSQVNEFVGDKIKNLNHIFERSEDPVFFREKILNEMLFESNTEVVVNYDGDILLKPHVILESVNMIRNGYDLVYPYEYGVACGQSYVKDSDVSQFLNENFDFSIIEKKTTYCDAHYGMVQFFNRNSYIEGGMENENFIGSAPDDYERYHRFNLFGYKIGRVNDKVYHLDHTRGMNSWPISFTQQPHTKGNIQLWEKLKTLSKKELKDYYSNQTYLEKYRK